MKGNHLCDVKSRKIKLQWMRYEITEDLKILGFWKTLKVYVAGNGKCRETLHVQVKKESED